MTAHAPGTGDDASLAAHAGFLRALARGLLFDRAAADDVAQRALLAALQRAPAAGFSLRAWLAGVVRNLARQEGREQARRSARELRAAQPEAQPSAADTAARLELAQRVVAAVQALDEPYRTTIVLRYFDGLEPAAIAQRLGAPVETVRTRIKRALARLRAQLDAAHGGDRVAWGLALLPAALAPTGTAAAVVATAGAGAAATTAWPSLAAGGMGALAMSTHAKLAIGAIGTAAAGLAAWLLIDALPERGPARVPPAGDAPAARLAASATPLDDDATAPSAGGAAQHATRHEVPPAAAPLDPDATFVLRGTTTLAGHGPKAGLRVHARLFAGYETSGTPHAAAELESAAAGEWVWAPPPPPGTATLIVTSREPTCVDLERRWLLLSGEPLPRVDLEFHPLDAHVVGRVVDESGRPLAGAQVQSFAGGPAATCDEQGAYQLRASSSWSRWFIAAWAPGCAQSTGTATITGPGSTTTLDFRLHAGFRVRGRVTDETGAPVAGARVRAVRVQFTSVETDASGRYELDGLDAALPQQHLLFEHPGFATAMVQVGAAEGVVTLDVALLRGVRVSGVALGPDGRPLRGARIWIGASPDWGGVPKTLARDDGGFLFQHIAPGETTLGGEAAGLPGARQRLVVPSGTEQVDGVVLRFGDGRAIAGIVVDEDGAPIAGTRVLASRDGSRFDHSTRSDTSGRFELAGLPDVPHVVQAWREGFVRRFERGIAPGRHDLRLVLGRAGALAGRVVDADTGEPVPRFTIRFLQPVGADDEPRVSGWEWSWSEPGRTFAAADGVWRCDDEPLELDALIGIEASAPGYAPCVEPRARTAIEPDPDDFVLELSRGARVDGQVFGGDGAPAAGARVTLATASVPVNAYQEVRRDPRWIVHTDANGAFAIDGAPAGACTLVVDHPDWIGHVDGPFEVPASGAAPSRTIALARGGSIEGVVLDAGGRPDAGCVVVLYPPAGEGPFARSDLASADGEGRFRFGRLRDGTYQVSSQQSREMTSLNALSCRVEVRAPESVSVTLAAAGAAFVRGRIESARALPASVSMSLRWLGPLAEDAAAPAPAPLANDRGTYANGAEFEFPRVEPGRYELTASCYLQGTQEWLGASETIVVEPAGLAGIVLRIEAP